MCDRLKKVYSLIGLAQRAGKLSSGTMAAKGSLLRKRAHLLIMSDDIAENTKDSLVSASDKLEIPWVLLGSKFILGNSVGKAYRVAITVNDRDIAKAIINAINASKEENKINHMGVVKWLK